MQFTVRQWLASAASLVLAGLPFAATAAPPLAADYTIPEKYHGARDVQKRNERSWFAREGVVAIGIGENSAGRPVIRVLTARPGVAGLPAQADGVELEVQVSGRFTADVVEAQAGGTTPTSRWDRPVPIGVSVGHQDITAGTIGCQVFRGDACHKDYYILSNNHVLANYNNGFAFDPILQPGKVDGGTVANDVIGYLEDWQPLVFSETATNTMDAAIAYTSEGLSAQATPIDGYGKPRSVPLTASLNLAVKKYGRTTRLTTGRVALLGVTVQVNYTAGSATYVNQMLISGDNNSPFSQGGDSGSLVVASTGVNARRPVALLFGGAGNTSVATPIAPILSRFGVAISGDP
jgi:hypothetical protein